MNQSYTDGSYSLNSSVLTNVTEVMYVARFWVFDVQPSVFNTTFALLCFTKYKKDNGKSWIEEQSLEEIEPSSNDFVWQINITTDTCPQNLLPLTPSTTATITSHGIRIMLLQSAVSPAAGFITVVVPFTVLALFEMSI